ncbi:MAG: YraN family protein [Aggregatilineales bacterium]
MVSRRTELGRLGEQIAAQYLMQRGYTLLASNWRCKNGEIDLVAQRDSGIVFVEVRTRRAASVDPAFESITPRKRERLLAAIHAYLAETGLENENWRVDIIAVAIRHSRPPVVEHLEDGLDW